MGQGQSPTREELEFVYGMFALGASDTEVLKEYEEREKKGKLVLPLRQDIRFVRQRRKEFEALKAVMKLGMTAPEMSRFADHFTALRRDAFLLAGAVGRLIDTEISSVLPNDTDLCVKDGKVRLRLAGGSFRYLQIHLKDDLAIGWEDLSSLTRDDVSRTAFNRLCVLADSGAFSPVPECPVCAALGARPTS